MQLVGLDFECYWAQDYSVTDLGTEAYVRDSRYETILVGIEDGPARYWLLPERFEQWAKEEVDWSKTAVVMHHAQFDGLILSHHYGVHPAMFIDTLSMARAIRGNKAGNSLKILAPIYGLGEKGDDTKWSKGKRLADFTNNELVAYGHYCAHGDVRITMGLADIFLPQFPADELALIDLTVKMFTNPVLVGDISRLRGAVSMEQQRKKELLTRLGYACPVCSGTGQAPDLVSGVVPCKACAGFGIDKKPFASSDKFAAILRANGIEPETKKSPTSGEQIWAFARTDSGMQKLLDDPDEQIRLLAEARVSVKSGIVETRAQRFADMAERGPLCVYLNYCGAHTLRWSGGDGTNFQNMSNHNENRPEMAVLKQSIKAPPGHVIVCADSSQGEARLLAWCSGQDDLTEAFRAGRDVYSEHASTVYGRPIDRKRNPADKIAGHVGKVCLGEGTLVITNTGTKPIERVTIKDMLWDGEEWIHHQGLIFQGVKQTFGHAMLSATGDHEILTGRGWVEWQQVITNPSLFQSALDLVNLPFSVGGAALPLGGATNTKHCADVPAGPKRMSLGTRSKVGALRAATSAPRRHHPRNAGGVTRGLWQMLSTALGFSVGSQRPLLDAITRRTVTSSITANGASQFATNGAQTEQRSCATSKPVQGGTSPPWKWIAKKWMGITSRAISGLLLAPSICRISGRSLLCSGESKNSKQRMQTYDLACAGPRHRFAVLTDQGPIIVHNCILSLGFGSGYMKAAMEFAKGALGAKPIIFTEADMLALRIDPSPFLNNPKRVAEVAAMPSRLSLNERFIHCLVTKALVDRYRARYPMITGVGVSRGVGFWQHMDAVIGHMMRGEALTFAAHGIITTGEEFLLMPNGMKLNYRGLEWSDSGEVTYFDGRSRTKIYGSLLTENIIQCLHRIIVGEQMLEIAKELRVVLMTHDEVVCVVPANDGELALQFMNKVMATTPAWATGLPLAAEGGIGETYAEC